MKHPRTLMTLALAATLALSACGSSSGDSMDGGEDHGSMAHSSEAATGSGTASASDDAGNGHTDADVTFAQMMIPHHRQAVEMSDLMLAKDGVAAEIVDLSERIKAAQGPEIDVMSGWLDSWGEPVEAEGAMEGHDMSDGSDMEGMMTEDQLSELEAANGDEASRMFLESMIEHHEGAVGMAEEELEDGRYPDAVELAQTIVDTQRAEITEMRSLLDDL